MYSSRHMLENSRLVSGVRAVLIIALVLMGMSGPVASARVAGGAPVRLATSLHATVPGYPIPGFVHEGLPGKTEDNSEADVANEGEGEQEGEIEGEDTPLEAPLLEWPSDGEIIYEPEFSLVWSAVEGAVTYIVELSYNEDFSEDVLSFDEVSVSSLFLSDLPADGSVIYWRVRAENGQPGPWSETRSFISLTVEGEDDMLPAPALDIPADNAVITQPATELRWFHTAGAESYQLQVSLDAAFTTLEVDAVTPDTSYELQDLPQDGTVFYWHVRAHNLYTSPWSETRVFRSSAKSEPEGLISAWLARLPWSTYAAISGLVLLALGIVWVADEAPTPCMVATAAYGTPMAGQISVLRLIRDNHLLSSYTGTAFVDVYYRTGDRAADYIARRPYVAAMVRLGLLPILFGSIIILLFPGAATVLWISAGLCTLAGVLLLRLRKRRNTLSDTRLHL